jgi:hypothetical protein
MDKDTVDFQKHHFDESTCFFTLMRSPKGKGHVQFLLNSLRTFGGTLKDCPVLVFQSYSNGESKPDFGWENVYVIPAEVDRELSNYWFGEKVVVCSLAEEMGREYVRSLVWLSTRCLILHPPAQFDLNDSCDAALRPVHVKNIGLAIDEPINAFWRAVYDAVGVEDCPQVVQSFVDGYKLRPYFNTHLFSIDPSKDVLQTWLERFRVMISDEDFQSGPCHDQEHQIFLHQAILSALMVKMLDWERIRILPDEYSYPLHLHSDVPLHLRPASLNNQVCPVYEGIYRHPETLNGLDVYEPLKTWIIENMPAANDI